MENQLTATRQAMLEEVLDGLQQPHKQLPSKYFYDERGSELFEQITYLPEYYLTQTERAILEQNLDDISRYFDSNTMLIELGSGSSAKTRLLLNQLSELSAYVPVDISEEYLLKVVNQLRREYPRISIIPVFADYTSHFELPNLGRATQQQIVFFPGSTIGNFNPRKAQGFLENIASLTNDNAGLLIGVDLKKDSAILEAAYNDKKGLTAQFNKNILERLNRELDANFDIDHFAHHAFYNEEQGRIEMHLVSQEEQTIAMDGQEFHFDKEESIHTENSYKYSLGEFEDLVSNWYSVDQVWTDAKNYFSLQFLVKR